MLSASVEIIAIGSELCYGRVYDTNSYWLADQLTRLGAFVQRITCVPDKLEDICTVFREALNRKPSFIISTGGLGPTSDDLTIEALSKVMERKTVTDMKILKIMAERKGVTVEDLPPNLVKMARTVNGASCLANPIGWAPVTIINDEETTIIALPGPPEETRACFRKYVASLVSKRTHYKSLSKRVLVKMRESSVSALTDRVMKEIPLVYMKPLIGELTDGRLPIEIIVFGVDEKKCEEKMNRALEMLRALLNEKGGFKEH